MNITTTEIKLFTDDARKELITRLIKEDKITLDEALILLPVDQVPVQPYNPWTVPPYPVYPSYPTVFGMPGSATPFTYTTSNSPVN